MSEGYGEDPYLNGMMGVAAVKGYQAEVDAANADLLTKLRPRVIVDYRRQALISRFGNVRITFDKQLSACFNTMDMFAPEAQYTPVLGGNIILEVKFDSYIPESIQAALQGLNAPQQSVSKYMICTDRMLEVLTHG